MTAKNKANEFKKARKHELYQLADILPREVIRSADPLNEAAGRCSCKLVAGRYQWSLSLKELSFDLSHKDVKVQRHAKPPGIEVVRADSRCPAHRRLPGAEIFN